MMRAQKSLYIALAALAAFILLLFCCRNQLLHWEFNRIKTRLKNEYRAGLNVSDIHFTGINQVFISGLCLAPENGDTLFSIDTANIRLAFLPLLSGKADFSDIIISGARIAIWNMPGRNNIRFLSKRYRQGEQPESTATTNYYVLAETAKKNLVLALNHRFQLNNFIVSYQDTTRAENIFLPAVTYDLKNLTGLIINRRTPDTIELSASVISNEKKYSFEIRHRQKDFPDLPFLDTERGLKCSFKQLSGSVEFEDKGKELSTGTDIEAEDFHLCHWRLAKGEVIFPRVSLQGLIKTGAHTLEIDSSSFFRINGARLGFFANYQQGDSTTFTLALHMPETVSDTFFGALPPGAFNTLKGISCSGTLAYDLRFHINTQQPDSLIFLSSLNRKDFHINHYGEENFARVNEPFTYNAYNGEQFVRQIEIGPNNPMFTPLNQISPLLIKCVLQAEDPSFMEHRGFLAESFRESIVQDYKEKRFARGGSTISMQFVKNVFLSRDKTVSRKAQEALIVYLIENLGLISKERMLEIYLNVIEWGPGVYGIGEASEFYFHKKPAQLSLQESLFLAAIIPNPKYFKYQFDKDGHLKGYMGDYFKLLAARLVKRNLIPEEDAEKLIPDVKLTGPARQLVMPGDSLPEEEQMQDAD